MDVFVLMKRRMWWFPRQLQEIKRVKVVDGRVSAFFMLKLEYVHRMKKVKNEMIEWEIPVEWKLYLAKHLYK